MKARALVVAFLLCLPLLLFHRSLFLREAFLPADQLAHLAPWRSPLATPERAWNVLRFDGITQFYPWRLQVAREWRAGRLPTTNPFAFAAEGGTPLLANSQSAPLYPPNFLFTLLGESNVWYGFGLSAALHLLIAAAGIYRLARSLGVSRGGGLLSAATFSLCAPMVCWLALPTFLCAAAWLPWLFLAIRRESWWQGGALAGLTLLSGHLQIALFVLLTAGAYALSLHGAKPRGWAGIAAGAVLALCLAAPQVLPSLELSRQSHRAATGRPNLALYQDKSAYPLPPSSLLTFLVPDFFGNPSQGQGIYWNNHGSPKGRVAPNNYAEWANYLGVLPLVLALLGALAQKASRFFAGLALVTALMAFGTWINLPFFFLIPGWAQTDNPGRVLIVFAFAMALLAGWGLDALATASLKLRAAVLVGAVFLLAGGLALAMQVANSIPVPWGPVFAEAQPKLLLAVIWLALAAAVVFLAPKQPLTRHFAVGLVVVDLLAWGWGYHASVPAAQVYPVTPGIAWLKENAATALIAPLNTYWSNTNEAPRGAVLPPNALTVYGLHDLAGYDSLFLKRAKDRITEATGDNPSPQENGNIVFIKSLDAAVALGAKYIVAAPDREVLTDLSVAYSGPDMVIYHNPAGLDAPPTDRTVPRSVWVGFVLAALGLLALVLGYSSSRRVKVRS